MLEAPLNEALRRSVESVVTQPLRDAMQYALFPGGKRIRPTLALLVLDLLGKKARDSDYSIVSALELVHASSLVHDDLPALDNDDIRRGRPSVHKAFNEATAILCGDALIACAFELIARASVASDRRALLSMSLASAFRLVCEGQQADLLVSQGSVERRSVDRMKTAALFRCSAEFGAILAGVGDSVREKAAQFGEDFGFLFQKVDDVDDGALSAAVEIPLLQAATLRSLSLLEESSQSPATKIRELLSLVRVRSPNPSQPVASNG